MTTDAPALTGGWITGRFRGHYEALAQGMVRAEALEIRRVRLLRGTLTDARFDPFGPVGPVGPGEATPALRQVVLRELWVAAGTDPDGHPRWQPLPVADVWLVDWEKGGDEVVGATGLGEIAGVLWGRVGGGAAPVEPG